MSGDGSLGYWSQETIKFPSHHLNEYIIYDGESLRVYEGGGRHGFKSQEIIQYFSHNCGFYPTGNQSGDDGRGVYRSQYQPQFFSKSCIKSSCLRERWI